MTPFVADPDFTLYVGDALEVLAGLPDESVHCVVTSPPYWGLRDYGTGSWEGGDPDCDHKAPPTGGPNPERYTPGGGEMFRAGNDKLYQGACGKCGATRTDRQLGLEPTPDKFVAVMVAVFREVRRVLRADGTLWLNLGDSYNSGTSARRKSSGDATDVGYWQKGGEMGDERLNFPGLKPKDLCGLPWRVAFALQADGWYLRSDIVWSKPNPMPESVTDRPTKAHEYVFLLSRSPRYFFDQEAVREGYGDPTREWWNEARTAPGNPNDGGGVQSRPARGPDGRTKTTVKGADGSIQHRDGERWPNGGRNVRSVWEIATQPYPEAHFATFPEALPERCIKAGTSERGCCPECGAPWVRQTDTEYVKSPVHGAGSVVGRHDVTGANNYDGAGMPRLNKQVTTTGWAQSCDCEYEESRAGLPVPCTVLDPFMGSGTTALVARRLGRRSIGIELNGEYAQLAARRLQQLSLLAEVTG